MSSFSVRHASPTYGQVFQFTIVPKLGEDIHVSLVSAQDAAKCTLYIHKVVAVQLPKMHPQADVITTYQAVVLDADQRRIVKSGTFIQEIKEQISHKAMLCKQLNDTIASDMIAKKSYVNQLNQLSVLSNETYELSNLIAYLERSTIVTFDGKPS